MFEYEAELERVRQQGQPLVYQYKKRKSDAMLTPSTGGEGSSTAKGKGKGKARAAKVKVSSIMGGGSTSTRSGSGLGEAASSSSSLGFSLMALSSSAALSSSLPLSLSSSRFASFPEGNIAGPAPASLRPPGQDSVILAPGMNNGHENRAEGSSGDVGVGSSEGGRGLIVRTRSISSIPTTAAGGTTSEASVNAKTRQRSKSESGVTVALGQGPRIGQVGGSSSQAAGSRRYATNSNKMSNSNHGLSSLSLPIPHPVISHSPQQRQNIPMFSTTPIDPHTTTRTTGTSGAVQSLMSPRSRSSSNSSSSSASSPSLPSPSSFQMRAASGASAMALSDDGSFATMRICEDDGSAQGQDDVTMSYPQHNQSHFAADHHQEGEGEGDDGYGHNQSEGAVALREDQVAIKKHKTRQPSDHHKK